MGSLEQGSFRYCGKQFVQNDKEISIDVSDNTRKVKPTKIGPEDMTRLRSTTVAGQARSFVLCVGFADCNPWSYRVHSHGC